MLIEILHIFMSVLTHHIACSCVLFYNVCITFVAGLLARNQYPEYPATGHPGTGFFLVSLCLKANDEMIPKTPSCYYMLLM